MASMFYISTLILGCLSILAEGYSCVLHNETFVPDAVLRITAQNVSQACLPSKSTVLVNGTAPGPELRLKEGRTYWIRVYNDMETANLTMHWHGLAMAASPFSDGTPMTAQWPIPPLHFFDYEIPLPLGSAGTYFYHSHVGFQLVSAAGPLIIVDEHAPYEYAAEKVVMLSDTFNKTNEMIETGLVADPLVWSGETAMVLFNGQGGGTANGTFCNGTLSVIDVEPDTTYRFRFIGGTALTMASLAIQDHFDMHVIEADGRYTKPHNASFLQVGPGQRFSVLLRTKSNPWANGTYYIGATTRERPTVTTGFAILRYRNTQAQREFSAPTDTPLAIPDWDLNFLEYQLRPLRPNDFPDASEVTRRVNIVVHQRVTGQTVWRQDLYNWTTAFPNEPYLVSLYKDDGVEFPNFQSALANNGIDPATRAFPAMIGEVVEIVLQNTGADAGGLDAHPFHAHGGHYYDIGSGNGTYNATANELRLRGTHPVLRDTTMLYRYGTMAPNNTMQGWRAWRLRITEPGVWLIHCHILQHMLMGMQTVWVMGNSSEVLGRVPKPEVEGYLTYGGDVMGNASHWPHVVHFDDEWASEQ